MIRHVMFGFRYLVSWWALVNSLLFTYVRSLRYVKLYLNIQTWWWWVRMRFLSRSANVCNGMLNIWFLFALLFCCSFIANKRTHWAMSIRMFYVFVRPAWLVVDLGQFTLFLKLKWTERSPVNAKLLTISLRYVFKNARHFGCSVM